MQRLKVLGGYLTAGQWRALARACRELTPDTPLHLTTRQDVELHDLAAGDLPRAQQLLAKAGLTGLGACGDTLRNVTLCPCTGLRRGTPDLRPLAWRIRRLLEGVDGILSLPRKFKITLSACDCPDAQPFINDIGLTARREGEGWTFRAVVAGSLGAKPGAGVVFAESLAPADVLPLVLGAVRLFAAEGDRENRKRARLRHVRERVGDEKFLGMLADAVQAARGERDSPDAALREAEDGFDAHAFLTFPNGDVTVEQADALAALADGPNLAVHIGNHHRIALFATNDAALKRALSDQPALAGPAHPQAAIVACPGARWCSRGLVDTNALADTLRGAVGDRLPADAHVCISGCPNGCAQHAVADIGLSGMRADGQDAYALYVGGGMGRTATLAECVARKLSPEAVVAELSSRLAAKEGAP